MPTDKEKDFIERTQNHQREEGHKVGLELLAHFLEKDLPFYDIHYIEARVIELLEETYKRVDFNNPEIQKARTAFLKTIIKEAQDKIPPRVFKDVKDETDLRDKRCEDSCQKIARILLTDSLLMSDKEYLKDAFKDDERLLLEILVQGYSGQLFDVLRFAIDEGYHKCNKNLWGVDREAITFGQMDRIIKSS